MDEPFSEQPDPGVTSNTVLSLPPYGEETPSKEAKQDFAHDEHSTT